MQHLRLSRLVLRHDAPRVDHPDGKCLAVLLMLAAFVAFSLVRGCEVQFQRFDLLPLEQQCSIPTAQAHTTIRPTNRSPTHTQGRQRSKYWWLSTQRTRCCSANASVIVRNVCAPASMSSRPWMVRPMRWSVTRDCIKLYVRIRSDRSPVPICAFRLALRCWPPPRYTHIQDREPVRILHRKARRPRGTCWQESKGMNATSVVSKR
jgi:hypothetical protein|eukprot:COSAG03_NODE_181_length_10999_cov_2.623394_9_plen_206_part_00